MSRNKPKQAPKSKGKHDPDQPRPAVLEPLDKKPALFPLGSFKLQAIIIGLIGFVIYFNSFGNRYALDDGIIIEQNEFVQEGISGIDDIMTEDAYFSYYSQMGGQQELEGGRYRPLSVVTFAIEQSLFGITAERKEKGEKEVVVSEQEKLALAEEKKESEDALAKIRHVVNVMLYVLSVIVLLYFLQKYIFPYDHDIAFLTALIFAVHPLHTEVVANVKSRDEIMSFLFIILTLVAVLRHRETKKMSHLVGAMAIFMLALLSKEYAFTLLALIPALLYIRNNYSVRDAMMAVMPYIAVGIVYFMIRSSIIPAPTRTGENPEVLNNPYLYATASQEVATKIYMLWNYVRLLVFPHPLSSDYSYAHYAYRTLGDPMVWASLLLHLGMVVAAIRLSLRRHILGFALLFYLLNLFLVSNLLMDIGATMGERLIYHSSFGFALVVAWLSVKGFQRLRSSITVKRVALGALVLAGVSLCSYKVIRRNPAWKNDYTLFTTDVRTVPKSVLANGNAGAQYINSAASPEYQADSLKRVELIKKGIMYLKRAVALHKPPARLRNAPKDEVNAEYVNGYLNLGLGHYKLYDFEAAEAYWDTAKMYFPSNVYLKTYYTLLANVHLNKGFALGKQQNYAEAVREMEAAARAEDKNPAPDNPEVWYNLGGAYYTIKEYNKAYEAWKKCLAIKPDHAEAQKGMSALQPAQK